jgi:hypothetical protein
MKAIVMMLTFVIFAAPAIGQVTEVALRLPILPRLPITGNEHLVVAPFIIATGDQSSRSDRAGRVDVQAEFNRFLTKQLARSTKLKVTDLGDVTLPGNSLAELEGSRDFWREIAARTGADYVISGVIDFDVEDRAGYRTEEYVSPVDGRTYYRQVLIEKTGFVFDIVVAIFDGDTGAKVAEENFRDFKEFNQRQYDELLGLFENLRALETQLVGIFVSQETGASRYLFTR